MIHDQIKKIIPYVGENFINFPLVEEGKYVPFVDFWQIYDKIILAVKQYKIMCDFFKDTGYVCTLCETNRKISYFQIYPEFNETDEGGYEFIKKDWSIEEMLDLLIKYLESVKK